MTETLPAASPLESSTGRAHDQDSPVSCPLCDGWGYLYEGGMSMSPYVDNQTPCTRCNPDPDPP